MRENIKSELVTLFCFCLAAVAIGLIAGIPYTGLIIGLVVYIGWLLYQLHILVAWLREQDEKDPPNVRGIFELLLDRTLREKRQHHREIQLLRATLNRQNRLISGVRDAVLLISGTNRIEWFNAQASELLNLQDDTDIGIPLGNVIRNPRFFSYIETRNYDEPILLPSPSNRANWLEASFTEYERGDKIMVLRDVTRMQRLEQMRTDFIGNLSHELRTPLTVLRGYLETLHMQPTLNPSVERIYNEMEAQSNRMAQLVTDLATLSSLESSGVEREPIPVDVTSMLQRIAKDASQLSSYNEHTLVEKIDHDFWLFAVEHELYSALSNLVFNAVRHTPKGTKISIITACKKDHVSIEVRDNGPGIEAKHLPRITERFYRIDASRNAGTGGTGLGLAIVKHAVSAQGGLLRIQSTPGEGAKFICEFPLERRYTPKEEEAPPTE